VLTSTLVIKERYVPIWAYIYCVFVIGGTCYAIFDKDKLPRAYTVAGDILDGLCCINVFLIAFNQVAFAHPNIVSTLCFIYTLAWSYHAHRHYFSYPKFRADIHHSAKELDKISAKKHRDEGLNFTPQYQYEQTEREAKAWYKGVIIFSILALLPYVYVYLISLN